MIDTDVNQEDPMVQRAVLHAVADRLTGASVLPTAIDLRGIDFTLDVKRLPSQKHDPVGTYDARTAKLERQRGQRPSRPTHEEQAQYIATYGAPFCSIPCRACDRNLQELRDVSK